jgi:hypothetical protein
MGVVKTEAPRRTVRHPRGAISSRVSSNNMSLGGYVQKGVVKIDAPRRIVRHPRSAISSRVSSNNMPLGGYVQKGIVKIDALSEDSQTPKRYNIQ